MRGFIKQTGITPDVLEFLEKTALQGTNVIVAGNVAIGKTTLLRWVLNNIDLKYIYIDTDKQLNLSSIKHDIDSMRLECIIQQLIEGEKVRIAVAIDEVQNINNVDDIYNIVDASSDIVNLACKFFTIHSRDSAEAFARLKLLNKLAISDIDNAVCIFIERNADGTRNIRDISYSNGKKAFEYDGYKGKLVRISAQHKVY